MTVNIKDYVDENYGLLIDGEFVKVIVEKH